jgi:hypothetical protein
MLLVLKSCFLAELTSNRIAKLLLQAILCKRKESTIPHVTVSTELIILY